MALTTEEMKQFADITVESLKRAGILAKVLIKQLLGSTVLLGF